MLRGKRIPNIFHCSNQNIFTLIFLYQSLLHPWKFWLLHSWNIYLENKCFLGILNKALNIILKKNHLVLYATLHRSIVNCHIIQTQGFLPCCFKGNNWQVLNFTMSERPNSLMLFRVVLLRRLNKSMISMKIISGEEISSLGFSHQRREL